MVVSVHAVTQQPTFERVILNQHKQSSTWSTLVRIEAADGAAVLTTTPEHGIVLDGRFLAASEAVVGHHLTGADGEKLTVTKVSHSSGGIINPITASGTLLVADVEGGAPVLAATHPQQVAEFFASSRAFDYSLFNLLARVAPASVQACYTTLEPLVLDPLLAPLLEASDLGSSASWANVAAFVAADVLFALAVAASLLFSFNGVATIGLAAMGVVAAKK